MQERRNSIVNALKLCLFCTNPSVYYSAGDGTLLSMNLMAAFMINPQGCSRHISGPFSINPLRPTQNSRHFADDTSKRIFSPLRSIPADGFIAWRNFCLSFRLSNLANKSGVATFSVTKNCSMYSPVIRGTARDQSTLTLAAKIYAWTFPKPILSQL